ncbi:MAG: hypothetical protein HYY19_07900 [Candidatus Rokubacteria bacterium]|nr:hypothetical protein [Candidatus Rokubacteria bacterium]
MLRFLLLLALAGLVYLVLRASLRSFLDGFRPHDRPGPRALRDELVRDPVCETYIPRSRAIARTAGDTTYYFCSPDCAARFVRPS